MAQKNGQEHGFNKTNHGNYLWQGFSCKVDCLLENILHCSSRVIWVQQWGRMDGLPFTIQEEMMQSSKASII